VKSSSFKRVPWTSEREGGDVIHFGSGDSVQVVDRKPQVDRPLSAAGEP
jgi:hypothetical protein